MLESTLFIFYTLKDFSRNSTTATSAMKKLVSNIADSIDLRVILSVLYIITEVMREELKNIEHSEYKENVEGFKEDLGIVFI